ncbi:MAG: MFS transporter [Acidimicrobiales bacterium]
MVLARLVSLRDESSAFTTLARTHALMAAGDTLVAIALAGSLFFSISPDAARGRVALYLALTMAPFAVVSPLLGPWIDRRAGGRRLMVIISGVSRAALCVLLADDLRKLLLFPEAFAVLVLGKGYGIAKTSLVPSVVSRPERLVEANAKLVLVGSVTGFVVALPGVALLQLNASWVLGLATVMFSFAAVSAWPLPATKTAAEKPTSLEVAELRSSGILLAAGAMAVMRAVVGFFTFLMAFWLREQDTATWWFGAVLAASGIGSLLGSLVVPFLRDKAQEERLLLGCLMALVPPTLLATTVAGPAAGMVVALVVSACAGAARLCFDAIVQRDAPDANTARSFARFETRFQLTWVAGALVPVLLPIPRDSGFLVIGLAGIAAALLYGTGRHVHLAPWWDKVIGFVKRLGRLKR